MKTSETKIAATARRQETKPSNQPFFQREGEGSFFSEKNQSSYNNQQEEGSFFGTSEPKTPFFSPVTIQPKLKIGQPGDKYEQEADAVAEKVVDSPQSIVDGLEVSGERSQGRGVNLKSSIVNPKSAVVSPKSNVVSPKSNVVSPKFETPDLNLKEEQDDTQEEEVQLKPIFESNADPNEDNPNLQAKGEGDLTAGPDLQSQLDSSKGSGQSLPEDTRSQMESSFGQDFSDVKIHTDSNATEMNKGLNAQAFTHGSDIYFNDGKYDTGSKDGQKLLAHELTHVVQQGGGRGTIQRYPEKFEITIETPKAIKEGDPIKYANWLIFRQQFKVDHDLAWDAAQKFGWKNDYFPAVEKGNSFSTKIDCIGRWKSLYSSKKTITAFLTRISEEITEITKENFEIINDFLLALSRYTEVDIIVFEEFSKALNKLKSQGLNRPHIPPISKVKLEELGYLTWRLNYFIENKDSLIGTAKLTETYYQADDPERDEELKKLKDKLFKIDKALLERLLKQTGFNWRDIVFPATVNKIEELIVTLKLEEQGFSVQYIAKFIQLFRHKALRKAFDLLDTSEEVINREAEKYKDPKAFKDLVKTLKKHVPAFDEADRLRAEGVFKFFKKEAPPGFSALKFNSPLLMQLEKSTLLAQLWHNANDKEALFKIIKDTPKPYLITEALALFNQLKENPFLLKPVGLINHTKEIYRKYPDLATAQAMDMATYKKINSEDGEKFEVLKDVQIDFRSMSRKSRKEINKAFYGYETKNFFGGKSREKGIFETKLDNIKELREILNDDPQKVWDLDGVIKLTMQEQNITDTDPLGSIVNDVVNDRKSAKLWRSIGLAALGIGLGIAGFFLGGSTWGASGALIGAAVGSAIASAIDLAFELEEYNFKKAAYNTSFDPAYQLSSEYPSLTGVFFAILGLGIDIVPIFKVLKLAKFSKFLKGLSNLNKLNKAQIDEFINALLKEQDVMQTLNKAGVTIDEFKDSIRKAFQEAQLLSKDEAFLKILTESGLIKTAKDFGDLPGIFQLAFGKVYKEDPEMLTAMLKALGTDSKALTQLSIDIVAQPQIVKPLKEVYVLLKESDKLGDVFSFYAGIGNKYVNKLPEIWTLIKSGKLQDKPKLLEEILSSTQVQNALRNLDNPADLSKLWDDYLLKKSDGATYDFGRYLGFRGIKTKGYGEEALTLLQKMGDDFFKLTPLEQNLKLLQETEPALAKELAKPVGESALPPHIYQKLKETLKDDLLNIDKTKKYKTVHQNLIRKVHDIIGDEIKSFDDFTKMMKLAQQGSTGSLGEAAAKRFNIPPGAGRGQKVVVNVEGINHPDWPGGRLTIAIDNFLSQTRKIGEIKVGTSMDIDQFARYDFIMRFQDDPKVQQALFDAFKKQGVPKGKTNGISYGLMPGPSDIAEANKVLKPGEVFVDPVQKRAFQRWDEMASKSKDLSKTNLEIHYLTTDGRHYKLVQGPGGQPVKKYVKKVQ